MIMIIHQAFILAEKAVENPYSFIIFWLQVYKRFSLQV